jgi:RsiW-degrading membrane proteinase PrsW (M82 family)
MVSALIIGIYLIVAGLLGNATCVYDDIKQQGAFIPWIVAVFILWAIWEYSPASIDPVVKGLIILAIVAFIVVNYASFEPKVAALWANIHSIGNTSSTTTTKVSGA